MKFMGTLALIGGLPAAAFAQFTINERPIQIHGNATQGFALSSNNNFLTMKTKDGSFAFTDGAVNASMQVNEKLRVGAQGYIRNIGSLGNWHPTLDWAVVDYKVKDWFGVRAGKVKTIVGLYNDTQDQAFLHTWAILPQSLYPLDLRSSTLTHLGGDIYGELPLMNQRSTLSYTVFAGTRFDDKHGGYRDVAEQAGSKSDKITGWMAGVDARWINPLPGLTLGASWLHQPFKGTGTFLAYNLPSSFNVDAGTTFFYIDYVAGNLHVNAEYNHTGATVEVRGVPGFPTVGQASKGWYTSLAYRLSKHLELGAYHSRFISDVDRDWQDPSNHIYDQVVTARVDISRQWSVKLEGHFMDGYGSSYSARGFYLNQNPEGLLRKTNMLVLRTGYTF
jgi:hypothetical protein